VRRIEPGNYSYCRDIIAGAFSPHRNYAGRVSYLLVTAMLIVDWH